MNDDVKVNFKLWLEKEKRPILGYGGVKLLNEIKKTGSLQAAIKNLGISYRYAWGYLKKIEKIVGEPVISSHKGGSHGGGGMEITVRGEELLRIYIRFETYLLDALNNPTLWEAYGLKTEKLNRLRGSVSSLRIGEKVAEVIIDAPEPKEMVSIITRESIENLRIMKGDDVNLIVKATEITLDKEV